MRHSKICTLCAEENVMHFSLCFDDCTAEELADFVEETFSRTEDARRGYSLEERVNLECRMAAEGWD